MSELGNRTHKTNNQNTSLYKRQGPDKIAVAWRDGHTRDPTAQSALQEMAGKVEWLSAVAVDGGTGVGCFGSGDRLVGVSMVVSMARRTMVRENIACRCAVTGA